MLLDSYGGPIRNIRLFSLDGPAWVFPIIKEFLQVGFYEYMVNTVLNYVSVGEWVLSQCYACLLFVVLQGSFEKHL